MVTIKEVAEIAGVSIATVSRVMSNSDYPVSETTRATILRVAKDVGYLPNRAARSLRTERSSLIGVILDNFDSQWAPVIIRGIQDILHNSGYFTLVVNIPWEKHSQADVVQDMLGHSVDGFIFVETCIPSANAATCSTIGPMSLCIGCFTSRIPIASSRTKGATARWW